MPNLILSRCVGQSVVAGQTTITVVQIDKGQVRLAFSAPLSVAIDREEVLADKLRRGPQPRRRAR